MRRATKFGDVIFADYKVLDEEGESWKNQWYATVAQDMVFEWIPNCPCKTKTSQETAINPQKFLDPEENPKVRHTDNSLEFGK